MSKLIKTELIRGKLVGIYREGRRLRNPKDRDRFYWIDEAGQESAGFFFSIEAAIKDAIGHANKPKEEESK